MAKRRLDLALFAVMLVLFALVIDTPQKVTIQKSVDVLPAEGFTASIMLPAVDDKGGGLVTQLLVNVRPGTGRVLTDIDKLLFWVDTQQSIQAAKAVAANYTGVDTSNLDISYLIEAKTATLVGGPSAGAGLTLATIAALEGRELKQDVMITGTINPDGTIGQVGAIVEKARAAKAAGAALFLVPSGESTQTYVKPDEKCVKEPGFVYCKTEYAKVTINVAKDLDMAVLEVRNIAEAAKYLIKE